MHSLLVSVRLAHAYHCCLIISSKDEGKSAIASFFAKGSVSTLRTHIQRESGIHYERYYNSCIRRGLLPHKQAWPKDQSSDTQATLDVVVESRQAAIPFRKEGLLQHICELVATTDEVSIY
jgi:hypothetical protein